MFQASQEDAAQNANGRVDRVPPEDPGRRFLLRGRFCDRERSPGEPPGAEERSAPHGGSAS